MFVSVERIDITSENISFYIEANPDNSGVRFLQETPNGRSVWVATIVANENNFSFATLKPNGIIVHNFSPFSRMVSSDGYAPPLTVNNQIEVKTPFKKEIVVRNVDPNDTSKGAIVGFSDGVCLWNVAFAQVQNDSLSVGLAKR